jgi:transcriptional regulator with XRE-family HTH domain
LLEKKENQVFIRLFSESLAAAVIFSSRMALSFGVNKNSKDQLGTSMIKMFVQQTVGNANLMITFAATPIYMSLDHSIEAFYIQVGEKVRFQRKKAGLDQETLARHLNLSRTTVINIEKGRQRLSLEHAWLAAKILGISIEELLPSSEVKTVADWKSEVQKVGVGKQTEKAVLKWISKVKSN